MSRNIPRWYNCFKSVTCIKSKAVRPQRASAPCKHLSPIGDRMSYKASSNFHVWLVVCFSFWSSFMIKRSKKNDSRLQDKTLTKPQKDAKSAFSMRFKLRSIFLRAQSSSGWLKRCYLRSFGVMAQVPSQQTSKIPQDPKSSKQFSLISPLGVQSPHDKAIQSPWTSSCTLCSLSCSPSDLLNHEQTKQLLHTEKES